MSGSKLAVRLFVKGDPLSASAQCPLRSKSDEVQIDAKCHYRTHAAQQIASLFDHLVGASNHQWRPDKTQSLGGPEVDDQFIMRGKLRG
jgi:hypothetical protein